MAAPLGFPLTYPWFWLAVWFSSALTGLLVLARADRRWHHAAGLALMVVPVWIAVWGFINNIEFIADPDSFVPARTTRQLSTSYMRSLLIDLGYVGAGFLLWTKGAGLPTKVGPLAARIREAGLPGRVREAAAARLGLAWFPVLLAGTWVFDWLIRSQTPELIRGDASQIWIHMTPYHAVMLSATAAVTEEVVYRGVLMVGLHRLTGARPGIDGWVIPVVGQAVVFAAAHGGYGTIVNLLFPLLFALIAGIATVRWGIWSAIVLHFLVDLYVFGAYAAATRPWVGWVLAAGLLVNVLAAGAYGAAWLRARADRVSAGH